MDEGYQQAMFAATVANNEIGIKIVEARSITAYEAMVLLNTHWDLYLYALSEKDMQIAKDTVDFIDLISGYLKLCGYKITFDVKDKYCVKLPRGRKN